MKDWAGAWKTRDGRAVVIEMRGWCYWHGNVSGEDRTHFWGDGGQCFVDDGLDLMKPLPTPGNMPRYLRNLKLDNGDPDYIEVRA